MHSRSTTQTPNHSRLAWLFVATIAAACGVHTSQNGAVKITAVAPGTGSITGGIPVTITGMGFDDGSGHATVLFGTSPATVTNVTSETIQATLPAGLACGNTDLQVSNSHGTAFKASAFNYTGGNNAITVTTISPAQGDLAGGTPITITGSGFTGGVGITLGGLPLKNIVVVSDTQITAVTPVATNGGEVDLAMRNCASQASLLQAFIYTTGLNGGVVDMNLTDYINPAQFGGSPPQDYIDPYVYFIDPATDSLVNALPAAGSCTLNPTAGTFPPVTVEDAGDTLQLSSGGALITLSKQTDGDYYYPYADSMGTLTSQHFAISGYLKNALYNVDATGGQLPPFTITGAFTTPGDYTISSPNVGATSPASITRNVALPFTWSGAGPGDVFEIQLIGYDNAGAKTNQLLFCVATADSGSYTIKATDMQKFSAATTQLIVVTNRRKDTPFVIPANGSNGIALSSLFKVGYLVMP